jgi:hypothetical protein
MTGLDQRVAELLTECDAIGIRLVPASGGGLTIDAPQEVLTPDLVDQLRIHKADLLVRLQPHGWLETRRPVLTAQTKPVCRCGSTTWLDVAIHDRQSNRRDCARCGRFIDFSRWYGAIALQAGE